MSSTKEQLDNAIAKREEFIRGCGAMFHGDWQYQLCARQMQDGILRLEEKLKQETLAELEALGEL